VAPVPCHWTIGWIAGTLAINWRLPEMNPRLLISATARPAGRILAGVPGRVVV